MYSFQRPPNTILLFCQAVLHRRCMKLSDFNVFKKRRCEKYPISHIAFFLCFFVFISHL